MGGITETITSWIGDYGLYGVFVLMLVDAVFPAASELVMVYGGALSAGAFSGASVTLFGGQIDSGLEAFFAVALAGTIGYTIGAIVGWAIGLYGGRPVLERHGRWLHVTSAKLERWDRWFEKYGDATVFVSRLVPVVRSFSSIPAGIAEMPILRYIVLTFLGSAIWCFALAGIGYAIGANWERFHDSFRFLDYVIVAAIVGGVAFVAYRAWKRRSRESSGETAATADSTEA